MGNKGILYKFYWKIWRYFGSISVDFWHNTLKILTYERKDGIIDHVRSTRGALRAVFWHGDVKMQNYIV